MARLRRLDRFTVALAAIAFAGFVWRVGYVVWMRHQVVLGDGYAYHLGPLLYVDGKAGLDSLHPPAWTLVLSAPAALGLRSQLTQQLITALIGTAAIAMTGLAARQVFGKRTGLIAAAIVAVSANVWLYEREILSEPLGMLEVAVLVWLAYRFRAKPSLGLAIALGGLVGVMAMTRSEFIFISVLLVVPLVVSACRRDLKRAFVWLAAAGIACIVFIVPWAAYNSTRYERFTPLSNGSGALLKQGNCQATYHGDLIGYYKFGCILFMPGGVDKDPSIADRQYRKSALDFMRDNAGRVPEVSAIRVGRTFGAYRPFQQMHLETERGTSLWVMRLAFVTYWVTFAFAVTGTVVARRRRIPVYPLLAFVLLVVLSVAFTIGSVRYRASAEIPLIILAAAGIDATSAAARRRLVAHAADPNEPNVSTLTPTAL